MRTIDNIKTIVRAIPLEERLLACCDRIGRMARETKGPRMSIPVEPGDDDIFITTTLEDAREELAKAQAQVLALREALSWNQNIRDGLDELFKKSGWSEDCTLRNQLGCMKFSALSSPPPPVVKMEDVRTLVKQMRLVAQITASMPAPQIGGWNWPVITKDSCEAIDNLLTTYPQLNS